jgi:hypothetical protein
MRTSLSRKSALPAALIAVLAVAGCTSGQVIDTGVGVAAGTTRVVAKTAVGATRIVYRGGRRVVVGPREE